MAGWWRFTCAIVLPAMALLAFGLSQSSAAAEAAPEVVVSVFQPPRLALWSDLKNLEEATSD